MELHVYIVLPRAKSFGKSPHTNGLELGFPFSFPSRIKSVCFTTLLLGRFSDYHDMHMPH
jgi:hypothetical protein